jgi:hypothetical protein
MTSQIVSDTIDENYPVAGQDNDSQGFRDNFSIIKDGLATANSEITDLQVNTAKTNEDNNFNGSLIDNAQTNRLYGTVYNTNTEASSTVTIDYAAGEYQIVTVTRNCTLRFQNWPKRSDNVPVYAKMRVALVPDSSTAYSATFTTVNGSVRTQEPSSTFPISDNPEVATVFEVWTASDGTNDMYVSVLGDFDSTFTLNDLDDVTIVDPQPNDYLKYINGVWTNDAEGPSTSIDSLVGNVGDVVAPGGLNHGDVLVFDGDTDRWVNQPIKDQLGELIDVSTASAEIGNVIRYTGVPNVPTSWRSERDPNLILLNLKITDNGALPDVFLINDLEITDIDLASTLIFNIGNLYRFDLSDSSNQDGGGNPRGELFFSLKKPSDPSFSQEADRYGEGSLVRRNGTPGTAGAYVEIMITKDVPSNLYLFGVGTIVGDNLGADVPVIVDTLPYYSGSQLIANGQIANNKKSVGYFETTAPSTSTLPPGTDGQIKTLVMKEHSGNMVVTVVDFGWNGAGTITFTQTGQGCTLQYIDGRWFCIGNNGATFA